MEAFTSGAMTISYLIIGLFFLRFWRETRDKLFCYFSLAFLLLGINRFSFVILAIPEEKEIYTYFYLVRLIAFVLILFAIINKNGASK